MVLWWIGNVVLLVVVLPVVIFLLNRVLAAVERIRAATDNVLAGGVALIGELNGLPEALAVTDETVREVSVGAVRYAGSAKYGVRNGSSCAGWMNSWISRRVDRPGKRAGKESDGSFAEKRPVRRRSSAE